MTKLVVRGVALLHLRSSQCRFPIREDASVAGGHRFCAEATSEDRVYCARHHRIAIAGPKNGVRKRFQRPAQNGKRAARAG
jgi:hypothetical protein